jgi:hypothetical protein
MLVPTKQSLPQFLQQILYEIASWRESPLAMTVPEGYGGLFGIILRIGSYSADREEPPHVHVERERNKTKFWLDPVRLQNSGGFSRNEINRIQKLIEENQKMLLEKWHDYFSD